MSSETATIEVQTWEFRDHELPRVPPAGWAETTDDLRAAVCAAIECRVDGIDSIEPFSGAARDRERFDAVVTTDAVASEYVRLCAPRSSSEADLDTDNNGRDDTNRSDEFETRTEQFDLDEALERL
jgi:hypothetical protein